SPRCPHDKGIHLARRDGAVGNVTFPCILLGVPADHPFARVERLAFAIDRRTVVENPPVHRPRPSPLRVESDFVRRIGRIAARGQVAFFGIAAAVDPVSRHRAAVVAQLCEPGHLLAGGELLAVFFGYVYQEASVELTRDAVGVGVLSIIPREVANRLGERSVFLIGPLHGFGEAVDNIEVGAAVGDGFYGLIAPLRPAPAVDDAAFLLNAGTGRQYEYLSRNSRWIDTRPLPETRGLVLEQIGHHHPTELIETGAYKARVGPAHPRAL